MSVCVCVCCWDLAHIYRGIAYIYIYSCSAGEDGPYLLVPSVALFLAPLVFLYLDDTKIFDVLPQLGGEPVGYLRIYIYIYIYIYMSTGGHNRVYLDAFNLYNDHLGTLYMILYIYI